MIDDDWMGPHPRLTTLRPVSRSGMLWIWSIQVALRSNYRGPRWWWWWGDQVIALLYEAAFGAPCIELIRAQAVSRNVAGGLSRPRNGCVLGISEAAADGVWVSVGICYIYSRNGDSYRQPRRLS
jgi:hypothetical protein